MTKRVLIVEARFYSDIADTMGDAALAVLKQSGISAMREAVPGAFELAPTIAMAAAKNNFDGYVALGCVIKGETNHFELVCNETARAIQSLSVDQRIPIGFGLITAYNDDQAWARARVDGENYGGRAASACLRMMELCAQFKPH